MDGWAYESDELMKGGWMELLEQMKGGGRNRWMGSAWWVRGAGDQWAG